jgi:hypothetical protein
MGRIPVTVVLLILLAASAALLSPDPGSLIIC